MPKDKFEKFFVPSSNRTVIKPKNFICPASILELNKNEEKEYSFNQKQILILQTKETFKRSLFENLKTILLKAKVQFIIRNKIDFDNDFQPPAIILFEYFEDYLDYKELRTFNDYIMKNKIGLMIFNKNGEDELELTECQLNEDKFLENVLYMTKFNTQPFEINKKLKYNKEFNKLFFSKETSKSILKCNNQEILYVNIIDDIKHVFISIATIDDIWLLKSLFIDSIRFLTNGEIDIGLKRYVQIDIDDIFAVKMFPEDAVEIIKLQNDLSKKYFYHNEFEFKFVIGFCGNKYLQANEFENKADDIFKGFKISIFFISKLISLYIENKNKFYWFDHTFDHKQPHKFNKTFMRFQISENIKFAKLHNINANTNYSVTPHHSGIYPVIPDLFDLWENEFYIRASSTSSYPDTQPLYFRRGFIYKSVHVAPRQPSYMYTRLHSFFKKYHLGLIFTFLH